ncbi:hypothetical protein ACTXT7_014367 [Hymenolepis weldensis]
MTFEELVLRILLGHPAAKLQERRALERKLTLSQLRYQASLWVGWTAIAKTAKNFDPGSIS